MSSINLKDKSESSKYAFTHFLQSPTAAESSQAAIHIISSAPSIQVIQSPPAVHVLFVYQNKRHFKGVLVQLSCSDGL